MTQTISIGVAAYNEREVIPETIREILSALDGTDLDAEILLIDDASTNGTEEFCRQAAGLDPIVMYYRNEVNQGFGGVYKRGATLATKEHYLMLPGDNAFDRQSIRKLLDRIGQADLIVPYTTNHEIRSLGRQILSRTFTWIMNQISGRRLHYYNGAVVHRTENVLSMSNVTRSFAFQAELICRSIERGASIAEVGIELQEDTSRRSTALRWRNIIAVSSTVLKLSLRKLLRVRLIPFGSARVSND